MKDSKTDINVRVAKYSGILSYVFNPKTVPARYDDALFKSADFGNSALDALFKSADFRNSALVISAGDRAPRDIATGLYYLCVFSHMTSTYSVLVFETPVNQTYHHLEDGWD